MFNQHSCCISHPVVKVISAQSHPMMTHTFTRGHFRNKNISSNPLFIRPGNTISDQRYLTIVINSTPCAIDCFNSYGDWWLGCSFPGDWWLAILFLGDWWLEKLFLGDGKWNDGVLGLFYTHCLG